MSALLAVDELHIGLKSTGAELVKNVSFSLDAGHSMVILGQSGSGKTMTCRFIMNLLDNKRFAVTGSLRFDGRNLLSLLEREKQSLYGGDIVMIPQNPMTAFDPSSRVGPQLAETLMLHKMPRQSKKQRKGCVLAALSDSGLSEPERVYASYPYQLSGGMLQRVSIAAALMSHARLIVADEPTTALDVAHRNETVDSFLSLREKGAAVLLVTHDFSVAAQMGGGLIVMKDGMIVEHGCVESILRAPQDAYTSALLEASRLSVGKEPRLCWN